MAGRVTPEHVPATAPQGARGLLEPGVLLAERSLDGEDEEEHGHERLGHDDAGRREGQRDAEPPVEVLADEPPSPVHGTAQLQPPQGQHHRERAAARAKPDQGTAPGPGHASGTPSTNAQRGPERTPERQRRAVSALSEVRIDQTSPHGALHSKPRKGSAKNAMAGSQARGRATAVARGRPGGGELHSTAVAVTARRSRTRP